MSVKLCCLCCTPCKNGYKYLQNDSGECNEIYETTVKYFDPMLLTDHIIPVCSKESSVLCQMCWSHIQDFDNFYQSVIKARTSYEQTNIQRSPLHIKVEDDQVSYGDFNDNSHEKFMVKNDLEDKKNLEENVGDEVELKDNKMASTESKDEQTTLKQSVTVYNTYTNPEVLDEEKVKSRKVRKKKSYKVHENLEAEKEEGGTHLLHKVKKDAANHPVLDKAREYDKLISEWKSQLECEICSESFPIFELLKAHYKDNHNVKGFVKCCDRKFDRRYNLVEHIRLHINPELHKCDICGKLIGSKYSLIHHKKAIHEESEEYKCNECPKIFKQKQNLKIHMLNHVTGNKDFKCTECNKAYVVEIQLKKHIKQVHSDNRICDQCGKKLHNLGALKTHLKEHIDIEKPKHPCDECGAELGSRITLKRHKAAYHNDGSTVYVCSICGKASSTKSALKNHKKFVHEIEPNLKCPHCDKAFKRPQNLQEHITTHTGEPLYQCPVCPRTFKISSKFHSHRRKAHPVEWAESRKNRAEKQKIDYQRVTNKVVI